MKPGANSRRSTSGSTHRLPQERWLRALSRRSHALRLTPDLNRSRQSRSPPTYRVRAGDQVGAGLTRSDLRKCASSGGHDQSNTYYRCMPESGTGEKSLDIAARKCGTNSNTFRPEMTLGVSKRTGA